MSTPQPSRLSLEANDDRVLSATGTIDSHTATELLERLRGFGTDTDVTLDLHGVGFIDSSGLRTIVTAHQEFEESGSRLVLTNSSESVRRLLEITGLLDHLHLS